MDSNLVTRKTHKPKDTTSLHTIPLELLKKKLSLSNDILHLLNGQTLQHEQFLKPLLLN